MLRRDTLRQLALGLCLALWALCAAAQTTMGMVVVDAHNGKGPITVFYPSNTPGTPVKRGPFTLDVPWQGSFQLGNRRLVVISHGSGGAPWPFADLARILVNSGFVVAVPEHDGDNYHDHRLVGTETWKLRPGPTACALTTKPGTSHTDPRIRAVIASVPMAAPIDMGSMAQPHAAVGLIDRGTGPVAGSTLSR